MLTLLDRGGRLLLHLREAEHGLSEGELAIRAGEAVTEDLQALIHNEVVRLGDGRYHTARRIRDELDHRLLEELQSLGAQGRVGFSYGSNMDPDQMYTRIPSARFLCRGRLPGYMLAFPRKSTKYSGSVAGVLPSAEGEGVWGVLYLMDQAGWDKLDRFERYPRNYSKRTLSVAVQLARTEQWVDIPAVVYLPVDDESGGGPPSEAYLGRLIRGAAMFGLPQWYQEVLQGTETVPDAEPAEMNPTPIDAESRSKYGPLVSYLDAQDRSEVRLTFDEIGQVLGFVLPAYAHSYSTLWSPTGAMGIKLAKNGWRASPSASKQEATFRRRWDEEPLLRAAARQLGPAEAAVFRQLYEWAKEHGTVKAGTGRTPGFTFQPERQQHAAFSAYTDGSITVHLGWLCRSLPVEQVEDFRVRLAGIPGVSGMNDPVRPEEDQHGEFSILVLTQPSSLRLFQEAVLSL